MPAFSVFVDKPVMSYYKVTGKKHATAIVNMDKEMERLGIDTPCWTIPYVWYDLEALKIRMVVVTDMPQVDAAAEPETRKIARDCKVVSDATYASYCAEFNKLTHFLSKYEGEMNDEVLEKLLVKFRNKCKALQREKALVPGQS